MQYETKRTHAQVAGDGVLPQPGIQRRAGRHRDGAAHDQILQRRRVGGRQPAELAHARRQRRCRGGRCFVTSAAAE